MSTIYKANLKNIPISYKWDKKQYYTCVPQSQNHKSGKGWWNVIWKDDNSRSVVNLTEVAFYNGNFKYLKQPSSTTTTTTTTTTRKGKKKKQQPPSPQTLSKYEIDRLKRIEENRKHMISLGLDTIRQDIGMSRKSPQQRRNNNNINNNNSGKKRRSKRKVVAMAPRKGWRLSRRLRNRKPFTPTTSDKADKTMLVNFEKQRLKNEKEMYQRLLARYKKDKKKSNKKSSRNLFLVPTGTFGFNDHTLEKKVPELGTYLWGFARGLYSRIFAHCKPGDIFLFTSQGTGKFNRIGYVRSTQVVEQSVCDKFWQRMDYNMGSGPKSNVGFPLLVLLDKKPVTIDWEKNEILQLCGYNDRLQSSRR